MEEFEKEDLNRPSKTEYYLMQIAQMVSGSNRKRMPPLNSFKLTFGTKNPTPMSPEQRQRAIKMSQSRWLQRTKGKPQ